MTIRLEATVSPSHPMLHIRRRSCKVQFSLRAFLIAVPICGAAVAWALGQFGRHESAALLELRSKSPFLYYPGETLEHERREMQLGILVSDDVLATAINSLEPEEREWIARHGDPIDYLRQELRIQRLGNSEFIRIDLVGSSFDPSTWHSQAAVVNAVAQAFASYCPDGRPSGEDGWIGQFRWSPARLIARAE